MFTGGASGGGALLSGFGPVLCGGPGFAGVGAVPLNSVGVTAMVWWYSNAIVSPNEVKKAAANSAIHGIIRRARRGAASSG